LSSDGKTLILYYEYGGGDIYVSRRDGEDWTKPIPLNENINTPDFWETSAFLTNDGQKLYFTSNRPGGVGNLDIYVSEMEETGDWGKASNLGPVINTPGREDSPALDPDGLTLYFSSDGHPTMGGTDIFKSEFKDGKWQKPVNLGYPINSIEDDSFFSLTNDRQRAYFSTLREEGNAEIYTLTFIEPSLEIASVINPTPTIQSSPTSSSTPSQAVENKPVPTTTTTTATQTTATQTQTQTPTTTTTTTTTPTPTATTQTASAATPSRNVSTSPSSRERSSESVTPPVSDDDFARIFLFFAIGRDDLSDEAMLKLVNLNVSLARDLQRHILIEGHTDNTGSDLLNKALSVKRANTVAKFLTQQGVDPRRLSLKAYGATRPAVSNDDELGGREINRRIEISAAR
jgi:outer membrane protein OmpA-like peptidoglycan-associated protein